MTKKQKRLKEQGHADDQEKRRTTDILGQSPVLAQLLKQVERVATTKVSVLVLGETCVGKGLLGHAIHEKSPRREKVFVAVNCGGLPPSLIESALFGHERGAFTSASGQHRGLFEQAHEGTLFLDEIGDMPLETQRVLLHVLEEDHLRRIGGQAPIPVDVRIIAATNRDLQQAVRERTFREDLFYRLSVFPVVVPPLRERREDIPILAAHFVDKYAHTNQQAALPISDEALAHLQAYAWPGNVRELEHWVSRMMIICEGDRLELADVLEAGGMGQVAFSAFAGSVASKAEEQPLVEDEEEKQRILAALRQTNWVRSGERGAAHLLGMSYQTLRYRMRKYGIQRPKKSS